MRVFSIRLQSLNLTEFKKVKSLNVTELGVPAW